MQHFETKKIEITRRSHPVKFFSITSHFTYANISSFFFHSPALISRLKWHLEGTQRSPLPPPNFCFQIYLYVQRDLKKSDNLKSVIFFLELITEKISVHNRKLTVSH